MSRTLDPRNLPPLLEKAVARLGRLDPGKDRYVRELLAELPDVAKSYASIDPPPPSTSIRWLSTVAKRPDRLNKKLKSWNDATAVFEHAGKYWPGFDSIVFWIYEWRRAVDPAITINGPDGVADLVARGEASNEEVRLAAEEATRNLSANVRTGRGGRRHRRPKSLVMLADHLLDIYHKTTGVLPGYQVDSEGEDAETRIRGQAVDFLAFALSAVGKKPSRETLRRMIDTYRELGRARISIDDY